MWLIARLVRALYMLYFQAETTIIMSSNSESHAEDVRSRKVYMTPLARTKGKTFFLYCLLLCARSTLHARRAGQRTIYMKTANSDFQHDLIHRGHGIRYAYGLVDQGDDKRVKIIIFVAYRELLCTKNEHRELIES